MRDDLDDLIGNVLLKHGGCAVVISHGAPCRCPDGFCWQRAGVGGYGAWCRSNWKPGDLQTTSCETCGAPFVVSGSPCWRCNRDAESAEWRHGELRRRLG